MTAILMPWAISRETDATNAPLSGGKVFTYQANTTTPYPTWADAQQAVENPNPVILDAGGFAAIFLDPAQSYDIVVTDADGVQIVPTFHEIQVGSGAGGDLVGISTFDNYDALRNQSGAVASLAIVRGRATAGDGGQGLFWRTPGATWIDDDGSVLVNGANVYARQASLLDPIWFGLAYGGITDQSAALEACAFASAQRAIPVNIAGSVWLTSTPVLDSGASFRVVQGGKFNASGGGITITFNASNALKILGTGVFSGTIQPVINNPQAAPIRSSWFAGIDGNTIVQKWVASAGIDCALLLDSQIVDPFSFTIPDNLALDVDGGSLDLTGSGASVIEIGNVIYQGLANWLLCDIAQELSIAMPVARPEWFGGADRVAMRMATSWTSGNVVLQDGATYYMTYSADPIIDASFCRISCPTSAIIELAANAKLATTGIIILDGVEIQKEGSWPGSWLSSTVFEANRCVIPNSYSATALNLVGCSNPDRGVFPLFAGFALTFDGDVRFSSLLNAVTLGTDGTGKLKDTNGSGSITRDLVTAVTAWAASLGYNRLMPVVQTVANGGDITQFVSSWRVDNTTLAPTMNVLEPTGTYEQQEHTIFGMTRSNSFTLTASAGMTFASTGTNTRTVTVPATGLPWVRLFRVNTTWYDMSAGL